MLIDMPFVQTQVLILLDCQKKFCQMLPQPQGAVQQRSGGLSVAWVVNTNESVTNNYSVILFQITHVITKEENNNKEKYLSNWNWCGLPAENWQLQVTSCALQYEWEMLLCNRSIIFYTVIWFTTAHFLKKSQTAPPKMKNKNKTT